MVDKYDDDEQLIDVQVPVVSGKFVCNSIATYISVNSFYVEITY